MRGVGVATVLLTLAVRYATADVDFLSPATQVSIQRGQTTLTFPSAVAALEAARSGDVVVLGPGSHPGPLVMHASGVTLRGITGARVDGNSPTWKPQWSGAPEYGPTAYRSPIPFRPVTMSIDQRVMIDATESRGGLSVHTNGAGRNGRQPLGAVFTYLAKDKSVIVSFADDTDPNTHLIEAAKLGDSAIEIDGADDCVVENLVATGGSAGVLLTNTNRSVVRNCLLYSVDAGVRFAKNANACKVLACDITWNEDSLNANCDPETADVGNDVWHAHKKFGTYDKFGISVDTAGDNNEIAGNYIYNVWNGITTDDGVGKEGVEQHYKEQVFKGIATCNRGLKVHHNRLDLTLDDALEPGNELVNNEWYSNVVSRARCATRIKTVSMGPFFYYDNVLLDSLDGLRLYKSVPEQANVYIANNVIRFPVGVIYHAMDTVEWDNAWLKSTIRPGTPNFHIYNNIFLCDQAFANHGASRPVTPNFKGDHNLYTCSPEPMTRGQGIDADSLFNVTPGFIDAASGNFQLSPASAGKHAGINLGTLNLGVTLPQRLAEGASGSPDVGLLPSDGQKAPTGPVTQLWSLAQKQLNLGPRDVRGYAIKAQRWIAGPTVEFVVLNPSAGKPVTLRLTRTNPYDKGSFKLVVKDDAGRELASKQGKGNASPGFALQVPATDAKRLTIAIKDVESAGWQIASDSGRAGVAVQGKVGLRKFDGVPANFILPVGAGDRPFTISLSSKYSGATLTVVQPDGTKQSGAKVRVDPHGVSGDYRVLADFNKDAAIEIDGAADVLIDDSSTQTVALRPLWDMPKF